MDLSGCRCVRCDAGDLYLCQRDFTKKINREGIICRTCAATVLYRPRPHCMGILPLRSVARLLLLVFWEGSMTLRLAAGHRPYGGSTETSGASPAPI
jgi:DNA-directed RNA polymerase subunit RPC12/RpoP